MRRHRRCSTWSPLPPAARWPRWHSIRLDLAFFESSRYFDTLQSARASGSQRPAQITSNLLMLGKNCLLLAGVVGLLGSINGFVLVMLAALIVPALIVRIYFTRTLYDWRRRRTRMERHAGYLDWLMTSDTHAKEMRTGALGEFLRDQYIVLRQTIRTEQIAIGRKRAGAEAVGNTNAGESVFQVKEPT